MTTRTGGGQLPPVFVMNKIIREATRLMSSKSKRQKQQYVSTGSTQLNLGVSSRVKGGWPLGKIVWLCGDTSSGKTWFSMSCIAEACADGRFKLYVFRYDGPEGGADMIDTIKYFGKVVKKRLKSIKNTTDLTDCSETIEDFYDAVDALIEAGISFIVILDSENSLPCRSELRDLKKNKSARNRGAEESQSYGVEKAKIHSKRLRLLRRTLAKTGSIVIIISQTRDNLGFGAQFNPKKVSGGNALSFYTDTQIWTSVKNTLKVDVNGKPRPVGMLAEIKVKKNRVNGKKSTLYVPFLHTSGIDDVGGCVRYLVDEGHWSGKYEKKSGEVTGKIEAEEFDVTLPFEKLVQHILDNDLEGELRRITGRVWKGIEREVEDKVKRKPRYA